ncbi:pyruvate dehydrogenase complex dihydrolipoamide acetyltransferase [Runella sp. MFBS21]|uniref:pyruvate dehydrogenase complex dihydrolipoamide acetyltransferase n=1 Tax=Runella sp. MFBS21 TaxID=3034018 RepID=UPI0023F9EFD3|nr:pyruvate dehydrogenase complex dihydrolipoamide acetyltransferase [Runella sp. MFBS21]MDF7818466.1 pyruvate dehydrogenase complex dihydrolipoamide acetyltransferase [Runella sp. MFBS21]
MAEVIRMPKMSDTMTEGVIAAWHKKVGDVIKSGDIIAEVETDKATMDLESYQEGTLLYIGVEKGAAVPVDGIMAIVGAPGEDYKALLDGGASETQSTPAAAPAEQPAPAAEATPAPTAAPAPAANVNATVVRMPKMSDTMTEGVLVAWLKKVGDKVKSGDILAEVETDKATMELENYEDGILLYIGAKEGEAVPVDGVIAIIGEEGADYQALLNGGSAPAATPEAAPAPATPSAPAAAPQTSDNGSDARVKASPLAKALAKDKGVDLTKITGSGEGGRIVKKDIDAAQAAPAPTAATSAPAPAAEKAAPAPAPAPVGDYEDIPVSQMRKTIARRLSESLFTAPHFYLTMEITMDKAMELRGKINEVSPVKISFNDMVIKAAALALKQHPAVNSAWLGDKIRRYHYVNIGVAVAVDEGLLVPVVRDADKKVLSLIAGEVKDMAAKAKDKKLQPKDWEGNTFSISNLGMFGIDEFTAIINPPDSCIMAVGGIKKVAAFKEDGTIYPTNIMKVTLSCDHRVVDGATGSAFLQTFKKLLENPLGMLV